ncbi:hypothetical protein SDC9_77191 [bioreactor metagenome]|uniref:Uncharacterized protein n=1 Tax=bioreactor metagenome TaxID=1076179 RepID=A0A644YRZ9_9ZZZZ
MSRLQEAACAAGALVRGRPPHSRAPNLRLRPIYQAQPQIRGAGSPGNGVDSAALTDLGRRKPRQRRRRRRPCGLGARAGRRGHRSAKAVARMVQHAAPAQIRTNPARKADTLDRRRQPPPMLLSSVCEYLPTVGVVRA